METENLINELKKLILTNNSEENIRNLLNEIGKLASIKVEFNRGKLVMRGRPNYNNERFTKKDELSFKPQKCNKSYQRASTPYKTMFYATSIPDKIEKGELDNMKFIGIAETIPMLRDKEESGFQKISFGTWIVKERLHLLSIIHKDTYQKKSNFTRELVEAFKNFVQNVPKELAEKSLKIQTYLADEFSKENITNEFDYMISAIFTEIAVRKGFDGVIYPSVRVDGKGFNVAINPDSMSKLDLILAEECSVYKLKEHIVIITDAITEIGGKKEFVLKELSNSEKECIAQCRIKSIE